MYPAVRAVGKYLTCLQSALRDDIAAADYRSAADEVGLPMAAWATSFRGPPR